MQAQDLSSLVEGCRDILTELDAILVKFENLEPSQQKPMAKFQRAWKKVKWDQEKIRDLRDRIISNSTLLNTFNQNLLK
jgi:hypothetical protein